MLFYTLFTKNFKLKRLWHCKETFNMHLLTLSMQKLDKPKFATSWKGC